MEAKHERESFESSRPSENYFIYIFLYIKLPAPRQRDDFFIYSMRVKHDRESYDDSCPC